MSSDKSHARVVAGIDARAPAFIIDETSVRISGDAEATRPKTKLQRLRDKLEEAHDTMREHNPYSGALWRHYKGDVYKVIGYVIDTDNGNVRVRYAPVTDRENGGMVRFPDVEFVRPITEWMELVELDAPDATHPNCVDKTRPYHVQRFVPCAKIERYETASQIAERGDL